MTNTVFNLSAMINNLNLAPTAPRADAGFMIAPGILAQAWNPLGASPFASAMMNALFVLQAGHMGRMAAAAGQPPVQSFTPVPGGEWTAALDSAHTGTIDLGDGYRLKLDERNSEITVINTATGETTRIWGDPHVDIDGKHAFDFWGTTTFTLANGTKITIDTEQWNNNPNAYVASKLTITRQDRAIVVTGISQNQLGDLSVSMSQNGRALDAATRDGFVLNENATGSGWRSGLTGEVATQADLDVTRVGEAYGPGSTLPSFDELQQSLANFLLLGFALILSGREVEAA
ncbi:MULTISPECIES: DUF1521 domain-containing protein [unclassified Sphingomonas]|jgi:hypothetical protein|uniref:DUF1521 domain-containing protein n=1 Tax=unclassified Sphingomonas TaxID=196159 RepID=UPI000837818C|nr:MULTISPECIES: DUF1521 domain-containing protein [unclassified Sphingomonas]MCH4891538.1 DUF1521 domain-containing protein [Sphingomonas sp. SFZ2018-12]